MDNFCHLHLHTEYSSLDGANKIETVIARAKELGQPAIAVTEHGNLDSSYLFYQECKKQKIKPILGMEAYIAPLGIHNKTKDSPINHITLLSMNWKGFQNLMKLHKISYEQGFYYKQRIDLDLLREYNDGIICLSGCLSGLINRSLLKSNPEQARKYGGILKDIFDDRLYIEVMDHGLDDQRKTNPELVKIAAELECKVVATNDCHYTNKEDWELQKILICEGLKQSFYEREDGCKEYYLKSREEMNFPAEYLDATIEIANRCDIKLEHNVTMPVWSPNDDIGFNYFVNAGKRTYKEEFKKVEYQQRLEKEVDIVKGAGLFGYFLTVKDIIGWAKRNNIMVGAGRGSAAGCLISYLLGITEVDPIRYNLMFSRFYNPGREKSLPDIDMDFSAKDIDKVIRYIRERYGKENVSYIGTANRYAPKGALKAVCRVFEVPYVLANQITDIVDPKARSLAEELKNNKTMRQMYDDQTALSRNLKFKDIFEYAVKIEQFISHKGVHASGIIISNSKLEDLVPLRTDNNVDMLVSCYDMKVLEQIGLVKYDVLKLDNLDVIQEVIDKKGIKLKDIPMNDSAAFNLITTTKNVGIFQLSGGMGSDIANRIAPQNIEDIAVAITLNRPGCIDTGMHEVYIKRRQGEEFEYLTPKFEQVLKDTYGVMIYQEQIILACIHLAGFNEVEADSLRKAVGKKDKKLMKSMEQKFLDGCKKHGILGDEIWELIQAASRYSFNKSHAVSYAHTTYYTAYLKAKYPIDFMCACLNTAGSPDKIQKYLNECRVLGINVLPPNVNKSEKNFVVDNGSIVYGFKYINGIGDETAQGIIDNRNGGYKDIKDFVSRTKITKGNLLKLTDAGCLFGYNMATVYANIDRIIKNDKEVRKSKTPLLFNFSVDIVEEKEFPDAVLYEKEFSAIHTYLTHNPLSRYMEWINDNIEQKEYELDQNVTIAGYVQNYEVKKSKKGDNYTAAEVYSLDRNFRCLFFGERHEKIQWEIKENRVFWMNGIYKGDVIIVNELGVL